MQFFFDLIWGQSRSRYLAEMGQMEAPNDSSYPQLFSHS